MDNMTLGIIYAIKNGGASAKEAITRFLSSHTGTPQERYTDKMVTDIVRNAFVDYLKTADNPALDVWQYFDAKRQQENFRDVFPRQAERYAQRDGRMDDDTEAIISALALACVREDGGYVNGFRDEEKPSSLDEETAMLGFSALVRTKKIVYFDAFETYPTIHVAVSSEIFPAVNGILHIKHDDWDQNHDTAVIEGLTRLYMRTSPHDEEINVTLAEAARAAKQIPSLATQPSDKENAYETR